MHVAGHGLPFYVCCLSYIVCYIHVHVCQVHVHVHSCTCTCIMGFVYTCWGWGYLHVHVHVVIHCILELTSSLVVSILAMSQVCMQERPETEMTASPLIQNSMAVALCQGD